MILARVGEDEVDELDEVNSIADGFFQKQKKYGRWFLKEMRQSIKQIRHIDLYQLGFYWLFFL